MLEMAGTSVAPPECTARLIPYVFFFFESWQVMFILTVNPPNRDISGDKSDEDGDGDKAKEKGKGRDDNDLYEDGEEEDEDEGGDVDGNIFFVTVNLF